MSTDLDAPPSPPDARLPAPRGLRTRRRRRPWGLVALDAAPTDGTVLDEDDRRRLGAALYEVAGRTGLPVWTPAGARVAVDARSAPAVARDLLDVAAAFRTAAGTRLEVGAGVAVVRRSADPDDVVRRTEEAAAESRCARDHLVVPADPERCGPLVAALRDRYRRVAPSRRPALLVAVATVLAVVPSFALYCALGRVGLDPTPAISWVLFGALSLTALVNYAEAFCAFDPPAPPPEPETWPSLTVIVSALLANEVEVVVATCQALLAQDYPGPLEVILAFNGPDVPGVRARLATLAAVDPRLRVLAARGSSTKAQNVNAALDVAGGEVVAVYDADHRPAPGALRRGARWLTGDGAVDVVQGHCSIRNGDDGWLPAMVAVEFEAIYAVGHPGRAALHQFAIFGGSNGFWRTDLLRRIRLRPRMLTEDIDASMRALLGGARMVSDPGLLSYELAPRTASALWHQRIRWAQGWTQVSRAHARRLAAAPGLSARQRLGALWLTRWRDVYPWVSAQMLPLVAYQALVAHRRNLHWFLLFFCVAMVFTSAVGPLQSVFARRLAPPHLRTRERRWWWWAYVLVWGAPYGEWRTAVCRAAHIRQFLGDHGWVVTSRAGRSVPTAATRSMRRV
ncbi:MAG TPA: glycosyltransferase family 2 protein [Acidimicrobiales bacterium]|nr:glycosyltransferase family 2 protein [Acidimicrobiales bacterium]